MTGPLGVGGGEPGSDKQRVALPKGHLEGLGEVEHRFPAGPSPAGLHEAEVPGGHLGCNGEVQLAEPPALAPPAEG